MNSSTASSSGGYHAGDEAEEDNGGITTQNQQISWGDNIFNKPNTHFRILTININGLPQQRNHHKYGTIREQVANCHIDIIGLSEVNLKWDRFSTYDRLSQRTSKWWENTHCSYSYNSHDVSTSKFQPGGTALLARNKLSNKARPERKHDPTGLGRWASTLFQGRQNKSLRIIQVYRPCKPNPHSNNGVYQQHSRLLLHKNITQCPRLQFLSDLHTFVTQCQQNQEQIVVMGDFNEDITQPPISTFFHSLNMHNVLHTLFEEQYLQVQTTYGRGTTIIDGIFATHGIRATRGGYLENHRFDSDHRPVWVDLPLQEIFGHNTPPFIPHHCRRLKTEDPRVVSKFNSDYHKLLHQHQLPQALYHLSESIHNTLSTTQQQEYERIDRLRVQCLLQAESKCRKLKTGNVEFSPIVQHQRHLIRFWKLLLKRKNGIKVDTRYLTRWERKLQLKNTFSTPLSVIHSNIKTASKKYLILKKNHSSLRDEWIEQLASAKAQAGQEDSATILQNLRQREKMRQAFRQIRWCLHQDSPTTTITEVTENVGNTIKNHQDKCSVERAIINANNSKYRQTNSTPPLTTLYPILGRFGTTKAAEEILLGRFSIPQHIDPYSQQLLKKLSMPTHIQHLPRISLTFNTMDYITGWNKMREKLHQECQKYILDIT